MKKYFSREKSIELNKQGLKSCASCKKVKTHAEFYKARETWDGFRRICKSCTNEQSSTYLKSPQGKAAARERYENHPEKELLKACKHRAKRDGLEFNLELSDIQIPEKCPVLGLKLETSKGRYTANSATLDRVDNSKGYVKGNVEVISWRANSLKKDSTVQEIQQILKWMKSHQL